MTDLDERLRRAADAVAGHTSPVPLEPLARRARRRRAVVLAAPPAVALAVVALGVAVLRPHDPRPVSPVPVAHTAEATVDGVTVTLELDRAEARVGETVRAVATVTNDRSTAVWFGGSGSCDQPARQPHVRVDLRPGQPRGAAASGAAADFKTRALALAPAPYPFTAGHAPDTVCTANLASWDLAAGETLRSEVAWVAATPLGSAYDGTATVQVAFRFSERRYGSGPEAAATLPLRIRGGAPDVLSPAAAVDVALADPAFAAFLDRFPPSTWNTTPIWRPATVAIWPSYVDDAGARVRLETWRVMLNPYAGAPAGYVDVDPRAGTVVGHHIPPAPK